MIRAALRFIGLLMLLFSLNTNLLQAQQELYNWGIEPYSGFSTITNTPDVPSDFDFYSFGLKINRRLSPSFSYQIDLGGGELTNLNNSSFGKGALLLNYHFDNSKLLNDGAFIAPYFSIGIAYLNLSNSNADAELTYQSETWNAAGEGGLKFRFGDRMNFLLFYSATVSFDDIAENNLKDNSYLQQLGLSLRYNFGLQKSKLKAPNYYVNEGHEQLNKNVSTDYTTVVVLDDTLVPLEIVTDSVELEELVIEEQYVDTINLESSSVQVVSDTIQATQLIVDTIKTEEETVTKVFYQESDEVNTVMEDRATEQLNSNKVEDSTTLLKTKSAAIIGEDNELPIFIQTTDTVNEATKVDLTILNADTTLKGVQINLDSNEWHIVVPKGEAIDLRINRKLFEEDKAKRNNSQNNVAELDSLNTQSVLNEAERKEENTFKNVANEGINDTKKSDTKLLIAPVVIPENRRDTIIQSYDNRGMDSLMQLVSSQQALLNQLIQKQLSNSDAIEKRLTAIESNMSKGKRAENITPIAPVQLEKRDTVYLEKEGQTPSPVKMKTKPMETVQLQFSVNSYGVQENQIPTMSKVIEQYRKMENAMLVVSGYSDSQGKAAYNLKLSRLRVEAVVAYLIQKGVPEKSIMVQYFGEKYAKEPFDELDRKVELKIIN